MPSAYGLVVFTHDLDFARFSRTGRTRQPKCYPGRTQDTLSDCIGEMVVRALHAASRSALKSRRRMVTVDPNRHRIRLSANLAAPISATSGEFNPIGRIAGQSQYRA